MTKAFAYLRVSGLCQVDGDGFPRQRESIDLYCHKHGYEVVQEFRDEGVAGTREMADRPGLSELLLAIAGNGVRVVLIERADRLARDLMVSEIILREFRQMGVKVISVDFGNDLNQDDDPTKVLFRQMIAAIAQWEKSTLVKKLALARARIRASGKRCDGGKPFGEGDSEKPAVARILALRAEGKSPREIADALNSEHISTKFNKEWHRTSVIRVLKRQAA